MLISPQHAEAFITGYTQTMTTLLAAAQDISGMALLKIIAAARVRYLENPALLEAACESLAARGIILPPAVRTAIESLDVKRWVYLRDSQAYSIFIDPDGSQAYAVLGLTNRLKDILGGSGAMVETGLMRYHGQFVCDGIVAKLVWLGSGYKKSFSETLKQLRAQGAFHRHAPH